MQPVTRLQRLVNAAAAMVKPACVFHRGLIRVRGRSLRQSGRLAWRGCRGDMWICFKRGEGRGKIGSRNVFIICCRAGARREWTKGCPQAVLFPTTNVSISEVK